MTVTTPPWWGRWSASVGFGANGRGGPTLSAQDDVLAAVDVYRQATRHLRALLDEVDAGLGTFVALVEAEPSVAGLLLGTEASVRRGDFTEAMNDFEATRRRLRIAVLRLGVERGERTSDVARALGISRQLAHRLLAMEP